MTEIPRRVTGALVARARAFWFHLRDEPATGVPHRWLVPPLDCTGREVCAFVTYAPGGRVPPHTFRHVRAWRAQGFLVALVVCLDDLDGLVPGQPLDDADAVLLRANRGYDFGAWATAIAKLPHLDRAARLVTVNDSVYGPLDGFASFVARLRASPADVVGAIESREHVRHFQSFLLAFGPAAVTHPAFRDFWNAVRVGGRQEVIATCELRLLDRLTAAGLSAEALFPQSRAGITNPTLQDWRALVAGGFPFVKVQLLRDNPFAADIADWRNVLRKHGYDPAIVDAHLGRSTSHSDQ